jgi:uncharacterized protein (DUF1778 family)
MGTAVKNRLETGVPKKREKSSDKSRFDTRLPKQQKEFFEQAAIIGGFRNLSEFVISSAQEQAIKIMDRHNSILASRRDKEIFFDAIMNPPKPNERLQKAALRYKETLAKK